jgi:hypothetical protein
VLCKALLYIYGPLLSLTPRGLQASTLITRRGRYSQLTALDLTQARNLVTDKTMKLLFKALPHLQRLCIPLTHKFTAPGLSPLQALLPSLTALEISCPTLPPDSCILDAILQLTQLRELTLPPSAAALLATEDQLTKLGMCIQLSSLTFSDHVGRFDDGIIKIRPLHMSMACLVSFVERLPALVALKVDKKYLRVQQPETVQQLQGLTALTKLHIDTIAQGCENGGILMRAIGGIASLQSLQLRMQLHIRNPAERGWLGHLSLLTSLDIGFENVEALQFDDVLSELPQLPLLRSFQLSGSRFNRWLPPSSSGPFACLAHANETLELLKLNYLQLPGSFMEVIQQLTHLTALGIRGCRCGPGSCDFSGLSALSSLRKLELRSWNAGRCTVAPDAIEGLGQLHTLRLSGFLLGSPYFTRLCAALPQLRVLDITSSADISSGVSELSRLTNLEVVALWSREPVCTLTRHLKAPPSLRRCILHLCDERQKLEARELLGRSVEVVFG